MTHFTTWLSLLVAAALNLLVATGASAETFDLGADYQGHYYARDTYGLDADDARRLDIVRSRNSALITISVRRVGSDAAQCTSGAVISGTVNPLGGPAKPLSFKTVRSQGSVYQLATFTFREDVPMQLKLSIRPTAEHPPFQLEFARRFSSR